MDIDCRGPNSVEDHQEAKHIFQWIQDDARVNEAQHTVGVSLKARQKERKREIERQREYKHGACVSTL